MAFIHNRQLKILKSVVKKSPIRKKHLISCTRQEINKKARKVQTNLLARHFFATRPHEKLVTDVSYVSHQQGRLVYTSYLAYTLSKFNDNQSVFENLYLVFRQDWDKSKSCLLHSDQGFQYTNQYTNKPSHSRKEIVMTMLIAKIFFSS